MAYGQEYARALFELSEESNSTDTVLSDIKVLTELFGSEPDYVKLLGTPAISKAERLALIDEAFSSIDENLKNLIKILSEKRLVSEFSDIAASFSVLYDASRGIEHVEAVTAVPMSEEQISRLSEKLSQITGKKAIVRNTVSPEILGGVKLRYGGKQLDGSIKTRLDKIEQSLKNTVI